MMGDRRSLMQDMRTRYLAMTPEEDDRLHRIIVDATNAVGEHILLAGPTDAGLPGGHSAGGPGYGVSFPIRNVGARSHSRENRPR